MSELSTGKRLQEFFGTRTSKWPHHLYLQYVQHHPGDQRQVQIAAENASSLAMSAASPPVKGVTKQSNAVHSKDIIM